MVKYCRELKFEETPNYSYLRGLIKSVFEKQKLEYDYKYDWTGVSAITESSTRGVLGTDYSKHVLHPNKKAFSGNTHEEIKEECKKSPENVKTCKQDTTIVCNLPQTIPKNDTLEMYAISGNQTKNGRNVGGVTKAAVGSEDGELHKWCCFM